MIEWWQAVLIGLFPSLVTAGMAIVLQKRQQDHEAIMQAEREQVERRVRLEHAAREHSQRRAERLYDFLDIIERDQGTRLLRSLVDTEGFRGQVEEFLQGRLDPKVWQEFVDLQTKPPMLWQDIVKEYSGRIVTVGHEKLRGILVKLLAHLAANRQKGSLGDAEVSTLLLEAKALIAAGILDPLTEEEA